MNPNDALPPSSPSKPAAVAGLQEQTSPSPSPAMATLTPSTGTAEAPLVPMAARAPPVGPSAHSTLTRLLQQSEPLESPAQSSSAHTRPGHVSAGAQGDDAVHDKVLHDTSNHPAIGPTNSVLRRRVSASCGGVATRRNAPSRGASGHPVDHDGIVDSTKQDAEDDLTATSTVMSMPVPLPGSSASSTSHTHHHLHLRPPTPDHFIAVTPPSPPRSRPHRPSPPMLSPGTTDDSIVAHALLSRAGSLPHAHSTIHVSTSPAPSITPSPPPSSSLTDHPGMHHHPHASPRAHSRVSCWSSGTAPFLSRSGASVPSAELSSKDHMALAGWSWETSAPTQDSRQAPMPVGLANAYPPPPGREAHQVRLPLTLDDLASGRPVVRPQEEKYGEQEASALRRHESAPLASAASTERPFSVWGVR